MLKRFCFFLCLYLTVVAVPAYATLPQHSLDILQQRARQGDAAAQNQLGIHYADMKNYDYASVWFRRAAQQGDVYGQYGLATLYKNGLGLPQDYTKAAQWYYKAALQGDAKAQYHLGTLYYAGAGVSRNVNQAINWLLKSAEAGEKRAYDYLKVISHRNQQAINAIKAAPTASETSIKDHLTNVADSEVENIAGNSLGLIYLQGAGAGVTLEAIMIWIVVPLLCLLGLFAI